MGAQPRVVGGRHDRQPLVRDFGDHGLAGLKPVQPAQVVGNEVERVHFRFAQGSGACRDRHGDGRGLGVGRAIGAHGALGVHQAVQRDLAALGDFVVVEVMRAGDLDRARPEGGIGVGVGDDGDQAAVFPGPDGDFAKLADNGSVARVIDMNGHGAVAQHGFGTGGGDGNVVAGFAKRFDAVFVLFDVFVGHAIGQRVFEVPHVAGNFEVLDFQIADRGFEMRIPVDQPFGAVDQPVLVHLDEDLDDRIVEIAGAVGLGRARRAGHGKGVAVPVAGGAQPLHLAYDGGAVLGFPVPDMAQEFFARHVGAAAVAVTGELFFHLKLRGNARMVLTRLPERVVALHPVPAHQDIHERVVEGMAHVQRTGDVGGRQHDAKAVVAGLVGPGAERPGRVPLCGNARLDLGRVEAFFHRHGKVPVPEPVSGVV